MRKIQLILIFIFLFIINSFSQIYFGGIIGANASKIKFDDNSVQKEFRYIQIPRYGYNAGVTGLFYFSEALNVKTDLLYTNKGFAYSQPYSKGYKIFNYAQLSIAGQVDLNPKASIVFSPFISPYGAYWISGKRSFFDYKKDNFITDKIYLNSDTTFSYNRYDLGISAGIEAKFRQKYHQWLVVGLKYEQGMVSTDIKKVLGWKNKNFSIYLEYFYRIKR